MIGYHSKQNKLKFQHHFHDLYNQLVVQVLDDYQFTKDKMIHEYAHYALSNIGYDHEEEKVKNILLFKVWFINNLLS